MFHAKPIVFVVDDDMSVRESLKLFIESAGWRPETFASGREFLAHRQATAPSCLVLDVNLGGMSGIELGRRLVDAGRYAPFICLTAHDDPRARADAEAAGCSAFLRKTDAGVLDVIRRVAY
jgi:FixJ family two-component response regulator